MPVERISFPKQTWNKLLSMAGKKGYENLRDEIKSIKRWTLATGGAMVIWEPNQEFKKLALATLEHEITFVRNKEGVGFKFMTETIQKLKDSLPAEVVEQVAAERAAILAAKEANKS